MTLLDLEIALTKRVAEQVGNDMEIMRIVEAISQSGRVGTEMIAKIGFVSANTSVDEEGLGVPSRSIRSITFAVEYAVQNLQRSGHSMILPILDKVYGAVHQWKPTIANMVFQTSFLCDSEDFVELEESSCYMFRQNFRIEIASTTSTDLSEAPCLKESCTQVDFDKFLPNKSCILDSLDRGTGVLYWTKHIPGSAQSNGGISLVAEWWTLSDDPDDGCNNETSAAYACILDGNGEKTNQAILTYIDSGTSQPIEMILDRFEPCLRPGESLIPQYIDTDNIKIAVWRNAIGDLGRKEPENFVTTVGLLKTPPGEFIPIE